MKMLPRVSLGVAVGAALTAALGCGDEEVKLLAPGAVAPEVVGEGADGKVVRLSEQRGKHAVVYFYPKDDTPGCTKEACAFRDAFDQYTERGVAIFGVSRDDAASHRAFREEYELPFPLVADVDGKVQAAYGVPSRFGMASRVTFVVGADGKISRVFPDVDPALHADEVLAAIVPANPSPPRPSPPAAKSLGVLRDRARAEIEIDLTLTPPLPTAWPPEARDVAFLAHRVEPLPTGAVRYQVFGPTHRIVMPLDAGSAVSTKLDSAGDDRGMLDEAGSTAVPDAAQQVLVDVLSGARKAEAARAALSSYCAWVRSQDPRAADARAVAAAFFAWLEC